MPLSTNSLVNRLVGAATLKFWAWASLISQILIVVTGGLVRLTGSGLGCPTWPKCTQENLVTVPEQGIHGLIEFGNRLLTFVLLIIAVGTLIVVLRKRAQPIRTARALAIVLFLGIPAQAVLGGFTVWSKLNPWFVGSHFMLSGIMITVATVLVWRVYAPATQVVPSLAFALAPAVSVIGVIAVIVGVLVTGAGPHSGDAQSPRNGLDLEIWQHYHSYPAYLLLLLVLIQWFTLQRTDRTEGGKRSWSLATRISFALLLTIVGQACVGVAQARLGVPAGLVLVHMLLASCLISLITFNFLASRAK